MPNETGLAQERADDGTERSQAYVAEADGLMKATLATPGPPGKIQEALSQMGFATTAVGIGGLVAHAADTSAFADIFVIDPPQWTESGELGIAYAMLR